MKLINYSKVRRSAATDLKKYERLGIKLFTAALKLQAKPNPSPLPMQEAYIKFYQTVFVESAKQEFNRIRQDNREKAYVPDDFFLNTWKEWIKDWVNANLGTLITGVNQNTLEQIQKILGEGIEQGLNPFQLEKLLLEQIPNIARARAIARTESTRAYNEGKKRSAQDWASQTGTTLWKLWIHGGAKEPRFQHIQAQDKPIRADQPFVFTTKGVEVFMDKPGDQKGGAAQTINCSCVVVYISEAYARRNFPNTFNNTLPVPSQNIVPVLEAQNAFIPNEAKYTDINQFKDKVLKLAKNDKINDNYELVSNKYQTMQNVIAELQGFRGLPKMLSNEEFLKLSQSNDYQLIYRGFQAQGDGKLSAQSFINQFKKQDLYASRQNLFGNGTYFANKSQYFEAENYGSRNPKNVMPALIKKSEAKIGRYDDLRKQHQVESDDYEKSVIQKWRNIMKRDDLFSDDFKENYPKEFQQMFTELKVLNDFGSWATSKGYDGYNIFVGSRDFFVSLNRTKLIVSESLSGEL
jgi:hypothetical protein